MTKIAWCDETINPIVGCSKISDGCRNCYAENMAARLASMGLAQYQSVTSFRRWSGLTAFVESELQKPYKWRKPRSIFVGSMGDVFHESVPYVWFHDLLLMICPGHGAQLHLPRHTFILLTKRPNIMRERFSTCRGVFPNLILGVSAEDQKTADERIPLLLATPAAKRFVSLEPMIGPVDFQWMAGKPDLDGLCRLNGVILGGESGNKARRLDPQWVMKVRDQCAAAGVPFMFKQWHYENRNEIDHVTGFPLLNGRTHTDLAWGVNK